MVLWLLRLVIFTAVWYAFLLFHFFYIFPKDKVSLPKWYKLGIIPAVALVSLLNLTPLVFSGISETVSGGVAVALQGPAIPVFGISSILLVLGGLIILIRKAILAKGDLRSQLGFILVGTITTYLLLIIFKNSITALI